MGLCMRDADPVLIADLYCDLDFRTFAPDSRTDLGRERLKLDDPGELSAYDAAGYLQRLVRHVLEAVDGRTLSLEDLQLQCEDMRKALAQARDSARLLRDGLTRPDDAPMPERILPSSDEAQVWRELGELAHIRDRIHQRDQAASSRWPGTPADSWRVDGPRANGVFHATSDDSFTVRGWAETPEAVADVLRTWSVPAGAPVTINWAAQPTRPARRLPHDGSVRAYTGSDARRAWQVQLPGTVAAFAAAIDSLRQSWSPDDLPVRRGMTRSCGCGI
jgi:hypothetical protein